MHIHTCMHTYNTILQNQLYISVSSTGWRRLIGFLNLQGIFPNRATNYRVFLRKIIYKDKASYGSLPPFTEKSIVYMGWLQLVGFLKL